MNRRIAIRAVLLSCLLALQACSSPPPPEQFLRADTLTGWKDPVVRHVLLGRVYYFVQSPCCDQMNRLFDEQGRYVCAPSGGFAGQGDGRCPALRTALRESAGEPMRNPFFRP